MPRLDSGKLRWMSLENNTLHSTTGNLGFFKCDFMPFGLCHVLATFQRLMQNCLRELNLIYCLIYLDDIVVFSPHMCCFLTDLESTVWNWNHWSIILSKRRSPTWHIESWRKECGPAAQTWRPLAECTLPQTYTEVCAFLGLVATTGDLLRGLHVLHSHSTNTWLEREQAGSGSGCHFQRMPWRLSKHWNRQVWQLHFQLFLTAPNHSGWRLMHPRTDLGQCCPRNRQMDDTTQLPMAAEPYTSWKNYHSTKFEFLVLKWVVTEHFKEYLPYQPFLGKDRQQSIDL